MPAFPSPLRAFLFALTACIGFVAVAEALPDLNAVAPDRAPSPINLPGVPYPLEVRRKGVEGTVVVDFIVGQTGAVISVTVSSSPDPALSLAVERGVKAWTFSPGIKDGRYVATHLQVPISFFLGKPPIELPPHVSIPDRPGAPIAYVDKKPFPVVGFDADDPIVAIGGAKVTKHHAFVSMVAGQEFAAGTLSVEGADASGLSIVSKDVIRSSSTAYTTFTAKVTADRDMPDVFMILVVHEVTAKGLIRLDPAVSFYGTKIGKLEGGKPKLISTDFPPIHIAAPNHWIAVFYSGGQQIRSTKGNKDLDNLLEAFDISDLNAAISKKRSGNSPLSVFRYFPLNVTPEQQQKFAGQTINVRAKVSSEGYFENLEEDESLDSTIKDSATLQLRNWLFVPRIKNGLPQPSTFILPIKF